MSGRSEAWFFFSWGVVQRSIASIFFEPTFVQTLYPQYTPRHVQILVILLLVVAAVAALLSTCISDRLRHRFGFARLGYTLSIIGFVLCLKQENMPDGVKYMALYFIMAGAYTAFPLLRTMLSGQCKLAFATGLQIGPGSCGGIFTILIFVQTEARLYRKGFIGCLGLLLVAMILMWSFVGGLWVENGKRVRGQRDWRLGLPKEDVENLGDYHPSFHSAY